MYKKLFSFAIKVLSQQTKIVKGNIINIYFSGFASFLLKYKKFFKLRKQFFKKRTLKCIF